MVPLQAANYTGKCNYPFLLLLALSEEVSSHCSFHGISKLTHKMHFDMKYNEMSSFFEKKSIKRMPTVTLYSQQIVSVNNLHQKSEPIPISCLD